VKQKGSDNLIPIKYISTTIFNQRKESKPKTTKPPPANRPHQTQSTDIEDNPTVKANVDRAHWEKLKALGHDVDRHLHSNQEVEA